MRIVVTGIGVVSALGCSKDAFWKNIVAGKSGAAAIGAFDPAGYGSAIACEVRDFVPEDSSTASARSGWPAFPDGVGGRPHVGRGLGIDLDAYGKENVGCVIGSAAGDYDVLSAQFAVHAAKGPTHGNALAVPKIIANMASSNAAIELGLTGATSPSSRPAPPAPLHRDRDGHAPTWLRRGHARGRDRGGHLAAVVDSYDCMRVLSRRNDAPREGLAPFDRDRDGFVIGEGACVLVLESYENASKRGARIYAELGATAPPATPSASPAPSPRGSGPQGHGAGDDALGPVPDKIGYINAHGTSTKANDAIETLAIKRAFAAKGFGNPPVARANRCSAIPSAPRGPSRQRSPPSRSTTGYCRPLSTSRTPIPNATSTISRARRGKPR